MSDVAATAVIDEGGEIPGRLYVDRSGHQPRARFVPTSRSDPSAPSGSVAILPGTPIAIALADAQIIVGLLGADDETHLIEALRGDDLDKPSEPHPFWSALDVDPREVTFAPYGGLEVSGRQVHDLVAGAYPRPEEAQVRTALCANGAATLVSGEHSRGQGLTSLAGLLVRRYVHAGASLAVVLDGSTRESLVAGLARLADRLGLPNRAGGQTSPPETARRVLSYLRDEPRPLRLLVIDNVSSARAIDDLLPSPEDSRVLLCVRAPHEDVGDIARGSVIDLGPIPYDSAGQLLGVHATYPTQTQRAQIEQLAATLRHNPLAMTMAAATMRLRSYVPHVYQRAVEALPGADGTDDDLTRAVIRHTAFSWLHAVTTTRLGIRDTDLARGAWAALTAACRTPERTVTQDLVLAVCGPELGARVMTALHTCPLLPRQATTLHALTVDVVQSLDLPERFGGPPQSGRGR